MPQIYQQTNLSLRNKLLNLLDGASKSGNEALAGFVKEKLMQLDSASQSPNIYNKGMRGGITQGMNDAEIQKSDSIPFTARGTHTKIPTYGENPMKMGTGMMAKRRGLTGLIEENI